MSTYTSSPIKSKDELMEAIAFTHFACNQLCTQYLGRYFSNSGNISIFCHFDDEYAYLTKLRHELTEPSDNPNQKFFRLYEPIIMPARDDLPEFAYTHLYVRRPNRNSPQVGDVDFYLAPDEYVQLKQEVAAGKFSEHVRVFDRPDLDMVEVIDPEVDAIAYISTPAMTELVHTKQAGSPTQL